ncbi:hypothetical protein FQR65_LT14773 [Abscondita terminalis]|nr:hypothetical protein FQR65_LT14773 [Abscondita terminalis]
MAAFRALVKCTNDMVTNTIFSSSIRNIDVSSLDENSRTTGAGLKMFVLNLSLIFTVLYYITDQNLADENVFSKNDNSVKNDRIVVNSYNKEYFQDLQVLHFKYNRSTRAVNITMVPKVEFTRENVVGVCQMYKRYGNEYKYFPIRFAISMCQAVEQNLLGLGTQNCGKISCPVEKNVRQSLCNWRPDFSRMPPFLPDGEYDSKFNITYNNQFLLNYEYFMTVYREVKIPT